MDTASNSGDAAGDNSLGDSFLAAAGGQFMVEAGGDGEETLGSGENEEEQRASDEPLREQDRFLPIANVARIMKKSIPKSGKIAKDAKECVQECVSEFISFITSEYAGHYFIVCFPCCNLLLHVSSKRDGYRIRADAHPSGATDFTSRYLASERCHQEKRKTINGEDILFAMSTLGFDSYVEPLKLYLQKYRESTKGEKGGNVLSEEPSMELNDDTFVTHTLTSNILTPEQQQNVIYTAAYPNQITQQISFG